MDRYLVLGEGPSYYQTSGCLRASNLVHIPVLAVPGLVETWLGFVKTSETADAARS